MFAFVRFIEHALNNLLLAHMSDSFVHMNDEDKNKIVDMQVELQRIIEKYNK
jgi:hypothetical protein